MGDRSGFLADVSDFFRTLAQNPAVKAMGAVVVLVLNEVLGGLPGRPLVVLLVFVAGDTVAGFAYAVLTRTVESPKLLRGAVKIILYFAGIGVLNALARAGLDPTFEAVMRAVVVAAIGYLLTSEAVSILEHIARFADHLHLELPFLRLALDVLKVRQGTLERHAREIAGQPPKP